MKIKALIFDYGGTLDTAGCHWGKVLWHAYQRMNVPVSEDAFREAYVYAERYLGSHALIKSADTFHETLRLKLDLEFSYLEQKGGPRLRGSSAWPTCFREFIMTCAA